MTTCKDFADTYARWGREGHPLDRRMTEMTGFCPHHSVGFTGYHIRTDNGERIYECAFCGCEFPEHKSMKCDPR